MQIDSKNLPKHIAIIMDGNGRWAQDLGMNRIFGHKNGVTSVREVTEGCAEIGIQFLTLYAFSTENWQRPQTEVNSLMDLLVSTIGKEMKTLKSNNIRLKAIGQLSDLPTKTKAALDSAIAETASNTGLTLVLALSYSSKWEITEAVKAIATKIKNGSLQVEDITHNHIHEHLCEPSIPDPELVIRTSGEKRISNFLLWQIAYSEFYFTQVMWPDFRKTHLKEAISEYQNRNRRFGKTQEQIQP